MTLQTKNKRKFPKIFGHLIILVGFIIVRKSFATESDQPSHETTDRHSGAGKNGGAHEDGHEVPKFSVFHVNFEHVEVPFIIGLWIFVSALAKVGEFKRSLLIPILFSHLCL